MNQKGNLMATEAQAAANAANAQFLHRTPHHPRPSPIRAQLPRSPPPWRRTLAPRASSSSPSPRHSSPSSGVSSESCARSRILSADVPDSKALNNISLPAARMTRQYATMLKEFLLLKGGRIRSRTNAMASAATLRRADIILKRPTDLAQSPRTGSICPRAPGHSNHLPKRSSFLSALIGVHRRTNLLNAGLLERTTDAASRPTDSVVLIAFIFQGGWPWQPCIVHPWRIRFS
jgi:hypothetical protein